VQIMAHGRTRVAFKAVGHAFGVVVNGLLLLQAVALFIQPEVGSTIKFCHWLGQGMLFVGLGSFGMQAEFHSHSSPLSTQGFYADFMRMVARRALLGVFYFWLGCCAIGGIRPSVTTAESKNHTWQLQDVTVDMRQLEVMYGYCAWIAAAFNLFTSCCLGGGEDFYESNDEEKAALIQAKPEKKLPESLDTSFETPRENTSAGSSQQSSKPSFRLVFPPGGWNSAAKPFGQHEV